MTARERSTTVWARVARRLRGDGGQSGLTIIEVLVGTAILVLGAGATYGLLGAATKNNQRAKATQVSLEIAQEEMERLRALPYRSISLNSPPSSSERPLNPGYRVSEGQFATHRDPPSEYGELVIDDEFGVNPESPFIAGDPKAGGIEGIVYRYVVWRDDDTCPEEECPGARDYKQIIVAVKPDKPVFQAAERGYVSVQSDLIDPAVYDDGSEPPDEEGGEGGPANPGEDVTAQQLFLSDTPCAPSPPTERVEITNDHLLHNTLGTCASGLKFGSSEPGSPDALLPNVAPDPDPADEANPPLYDYSDDFYLEPTPDTDKGLQIQRDDTSGCHYVPTGTTNPESQVHRWVTDPLAEDFTMDGLVTLEFYTRTLNDALYPGALCVYLFDRTETDEAPEAEDSLLRRAGSEDRHWTYVPEGTGYWPRNYWTRVRLTMEIADAPHTVAAGDRLGIALSVDRGGTPPAAIPIMYDHPNYPTRIEVETETPIETGGEEEAEGG